ncbi:MAG: PAS domain S-box protein [Alphaproteobacteria bacterium]
MTSDKGIGSVLSPLGRSRRIADELMSARALIQLFIRHTPIAMAMFDSEMRYLAVSDRWRSDYGLIDQDVIGLSLYDLMPDADTMWRSLHERCLAGESMSSEDVFLRADGRRERMRWELQPWHGEKGDIGGLVMVTEIVTERRKVEQEARIRDAAMASAISPMAMFDMSAQTTYANHAFAGMLGYEMADDLVGRSLDTYWSSADEAALVWQTLMDTGRWIGTVDARGHEGARRVVQVSANLVHSSQGDPIGVMASCVDITAQRHTEAALSETERRLASLMDSLPGGFVFRCRNDLFWSMELVSKGCFDVLGYAPEALVDNKVAAFADLVHPEDEKRVRGEILEAVNRARPFQVSYRVVSRGGDVKWVMQQGTPQYAESGEVLALEGVVLDITERVVANRNMDREKERAEQYLDVAASIILSLDRQGNVSRFNRKGTEVIGFTEAELAGRNWFELLVDPAEQAEAKSAFAAIVDGTGEDSPYLENQIRDKSGGKRVIGWHLTRIRDDNGRVVSVLGSGEDLTDRREIERQLLQAHKMQAVGELTGGLAHDFNNLLMAVQGNIEFLREEVASGSDAERYADSALKAVGRGAELTQRLLAFSRKQLLRPAPTALNRLVADMYELLNRTLGTHIKVVTDLADDVGHPLVDPGQLENALINLAINARDAMRDGGTLTISSSNVHVNDALATRLRVLEPGDYVILKVTDTGTGMPQEIVDRAFEPFFTTKDVKKGSGLGLSMVYGFVKQSGGHIEMESEVGKGTSVSIYLPRAEAGAEQTPDLDPELAEVPGGSETLLVVEDDEDVRSLIVGSLKGLGYDVRDASSASDARWMLHEGLKPDMVVTDVMQPRGMDGIELALSVRKDLPGCAILLVSGYSEDVLERNGQLDKPFPLLRKPFGRKDLASRVRGLLDARITSVDMLG